MRAQAFFAPKNEATAMAIDISHIGQVQVTPIAQEQIPPEACRLGQIIPFGIGIGTQRDRDGGILESIHGTVQFNGGGLNGVETAGEPLGKGFIWMAKELPS